MPQRLLRPSASVRASISDDGLILLDIDGGLVLSSNHVGARIWKLIEERRTPGDIARQLSSDYDLPFDRAHEDVTRFVSALVARGVIDEEVRP